MKKALFSLICLASIALTLSALKFVSDWFIVYILIAPIFLRLLLESIYVKLFSYNEKVKKTFHVITLLAYLGVLTLIAYAIATIELGNSWI